MIRIFNSPRDALWDYAQRVYAELTLAAMARPANGCRRYGAAQGVVLARDGAFQAELFVFPGGLNIPPHRHPHVDTIEIQISGSLILWVDGVRAQRGFSLEQSAELFQGKGFRIPRNAEHSVEIGPRGACFLSVQEWHDVAPHSIGMDWSGQVYSEEQRDAASA